MNIDIDPESFMRDIYFSFNIKTTIGYGGLIGTKTHLIFFTY